MKHFIAVLSILFSFNSISQSLIEDSIWFDHDQSFRKIKIWLPADYDASKTYQTIYCLDASFLFNPLVSSVEIYSDADLAKIPPSIAVGLYFDQRNDDMDINWRNGTLNKTGIAFMELIDSILIPRIESNYSVSNYRSIIGHSNSSSFIQFFLWKEKPIFQGYLSMSQFEFESDIPNFCNLSIPDSRPIDFTAITGKLDAEYRYESGIKHERIIDSCAIPNFKFNHIILESADHLSMVPQGIPLGLEALYSSFSFKQIEIDSLISQIGDQEAIDFMNQRVNARAEKYGVQPTFSFDDLIQLYDIYVHRKDSINLHWATEKYAELFKDSSEYFYEAQHLEMIKAYNTAEKSYLRHLEYYASPGIWSYKRIIWLYMSKLKKIDQALNWCEKGFYALDGTELIDLIVRISNKNPDFKSQSKKLLKKLAKATESKDNQKYIAEKIKALE